MKAIDIQVYKKIFYDILLWTTWLLEKLVRSLKKKVLAITHHFFPSADSSRTGNNL